MEREREQLKTLMERIARAVSSVHGTVTKAEANERKRLERHIGETWDPMCRVWRPL